MQADATSTVVDEDAEARVAKRQRVSQACAPCRYSKLRCDGQQPSCTTCRQQEKRCKYEVSSKRRGLRSGYVRALELLWGITFRELEDADLVVDKLLARLSRQDLTASSDRTDPSTHSSVLLDSWKRSNVARHIDDLLNDNDEQEADGADCEPQNELPQFHLESKPFWKVVRNEPQTALDHARTRIPESSVDHMYGSNSSVQPPPYASQLLQLFFNCGQAWLPILERYVTLKTVFQYSMDSSMSNYGDRAALWAVYAYASAALSHLLSDEESRQHARLHRGEFYAQAYSMLPLDSNYPIELGHVQCIAVLALTRLSSGAPTAAWRLMKVATQMLKEMTMQQQRAREDDAIARAWLVCFVLDTISSLCRQGVPSLHYSDVERFLQIDENGAEEWQPWQRLGLPQDHDVPNRIHTHVPTHSAGLLVLQVKLLRFLNRNLYLQNTPWQLTEAEFDGWNQDLANYLIHTDLTTVLADTSLNLLLLPPGFMALSTICTMLVNNASCTSNFSLQASISTLTEMKYPLLPQDSLVKIKKDDVFCKTYPVLRLILDTTVINGSDGVSNTVSDQPGLSLPPDPVVNAQISSSGLQQIDIEVGPSNGQNSSQSFGNYGNQLLFSGESDANIGPLEDPANEQGPGSMPSVDSFGLPVDAPFLDFMDGLEDRSM